MISDFVLNAYVQLEQFTLVFFFFAIGYKLTLTLHDEARIDMREEYEIG